jgi:hypothetical protein
MSPAERAARLRALTIGWTLGIVLTCILIGFTIWCLLGKRRCCFKPRERDFTGYHVRMEGGSSVPRVQDFDTRTEAEKRDEAMWKRREEEARKREEEREMEGK